jgi:hypothetical protein
MARFTLRKAKDKAASALREKAIANAKVELALNGKSAADLTEEDLEIIVADHEEQLKKKFWTGTTIAAMAFLGLN